MKNTLELKTPTLSALQMHRQKKVLLAKIWGSVDWRKKFFWLKEVLIVVGCVLSSALGSFNQNSSIGAAWPQGDQNLGFCLVSGSLDCFHNDIWFWRLSSYSWPSTGFWSGPFVDQSIIEPTGSGTTGSVVRFHVQLEKRNQHLNKVLVLAALTPVDQNQMVPGPSASRVLVFSSRVWDLDLFLVLVLLGPDKTLLAHVLIHFVFCSDKH